MTGAPRATAVAADDAGERSRLALAHLLDELAAVLLQVPPGAYLAKPLPGVSGSVGEHVRHILDHVAAFIAARPHGVLTYDARERGTAVETDTSAALRTTLRLRSMLTVARDEDLDAPVVVTSVLARDEPPVTVSSTLRRELAFVVGHTIHHQALIAVLLSVRGLGVPEAFGFAPSTPHPARS